MRLGRVWVPVLGALAMALPCQAAVQANAPDGPMILSDARGHRLRFADGREERLPLAPHAAVWELAELDRGWVATASDGGSGGRLAVLVGDRGSIKSIPTPTPAPAAIQRRGVPLIADGHLAGMAWLEGSRAGGFGVRAAAFASGGFGEPQWISRPGSGSQLGLAGAVLADGSWLLVWSAFDGNDDEIVAARRVDAEWQPAQRIGANNEVPDITPALVATGDGALAAWSRYDGDRYGLVRARFADGRWQETGEPEPGLYPAFRGGHETPLLLFFAAGRSGWSALALDERGGILRRADAPGPAGDETPVVERTGAGIVLRAEPRSLPYAAPWREPW